MMPNRFDATLCRAGGERGVSLLTAVVMVLIVTAFTGVMFSLSLAETQSAVHGLDKVAATSAAEGATQIAANAIREAAARWTPLTSPSSAQVTIGGRPASYSIVPIGTPYTGTGTNGLSTTFRRYAITGKASVGVASSTVSRVVQIAVSHLFQFGVFYDGDLEVLPGPAMTFSGRIHSNRDMYVACNNSLLIDTTYCRAAGSIYRHRKNDPGYPPGDVDVLVNGSPGTYREWDPSLESTRPTFPTDVINEFGGTVQGGANGVTKLTVPSLESTAPGGYYDLNAGLSIKDGRAYSGGLDVTAALTASGALSEKSLYDARENKTVALTQIDVSKLGAYFPANGLIYAKRPASTSQPDGIRITGASTLPQGLTLVSPNPVYVWKDFNTVQKKPAAVICDALNLLSNAWNDTKKANSSLPRASSTTYNLSFVTGNTNSDPATGQYSGGLENLPRFHENWSGKTCTLNGSFACLWNSAVAQAKWVYGGKVYQAPIRNWSYDPQLLTGALPPFTPQSVRISTSGYVED